MSVRLGRLRPRLSRGELVALVTLLVLFAPGAVSRSDAQAGKAVAGAFEVRAGPVELPGRRSERSRTYRNPDGTFTAEVFAGPVHFRGGDGSWKAIDSTLVPAAAAGYRWRNAANAFRALFAEQLGDRFLRLELGGAAFALTLEGAAPAVGAASGESVTYAGVFPDVDLRYDVTALGVKETLVLKSREVPRSFRFRLTPLDEAARRLRVQGERDGSVSVYVPPRQEPAFVLALPRAFDSSALGGARPNSLANASLAVTKAGAEYVLDLSIDERWLDDPARGFPVLLDPTIRGLGPGWTSFNAACSACAVDAAPERLPVGTDASAVWRASLGFGLNEIPAGVTVTDAQLGMYFDGVCIGGACGGGSHTLNVHRQTAYGSTSGAIQHDPVVLASFSLDTSVANRWISWNVTSTVAAAGQANVDFVAKRSTEGLNAGGPSLQGRPSQVTGGDRVLEPRLLVTYGGDGVQLLEPTTVHSNGADLEWTRYAGAGAFGGYEVHRQFGSSSVFTPSAETLIATISDAAVTSFRDTTAAPSSPAAYRIVVNGSISNQVSVVLPQAGTAKTTLQPAGELAAVSPVTLFDGFTNCANYGAVETLRVGPQSDGVNRGLVRFDLREIPAGATITDAKLSLWRYAPSSGSATVDVHRVKEAWLEGSGTGGSCATSDGATWYDSAPAIPWSSRGVAFDGTPATSKTITFVDNPAGWDEFSLTGLVQQWVASAEANHGVLLKTSGEARTAAPPVSYWTDDFTGESRLRPKLTVTYEDGSISRGPQVAITAPRAGTVQGQVTIVAAASDDSRVSEVEFYANGALLGTDTSPPYSATWTASCSSNCTSPRVLEARARDDVANQTTASVQVNVAAAPSVSLTEPAAGAQLPYRYAEVVPADGPASWWRLGELPGALVAADAQGTVPGTYVGGPTLGAAGALPGNGAVSLDGVNDEVALGDNYGFANTSPFTVEAWVKPGLIDATERRVIAKLGNDSQGRLQGWDLRVSSAGFALARTRTAMNFFGQVVTTVHKATYLPPGFAPGTWYHVVGVYGGSQISLYVDGQQRASASSSQNLIATGEQLRIGRRAAGDYFNGVVDDVSVYQSALPASKIARHYEAGAYPSRLRLTAGALGTVPLKSVEFYADGRYLGEDTTSPYELTWDTLSETKPGYDGTVSLTARATDVYGQSTTSAAGAVTLRNTQGTRYRATFASSERPRAMLYVPGAPSQQQVEVQLTVSNASSSTWTAADTGIRYRWLSADGATAIATGATVPLGADLAPNGSRSYDLLVDPPALPDGASKARYLLRFDVVELPGAIGYASKGNRPLEQFVTVQKPLAGQLGLERYYHYAGEPLGLGASQLVNLGTGNNLLRWTPLASPGRGLSTVVDVTYNSFEAGSESPLGTNVSLAISSLSRFGTPLEVHPTAEEAAAGMTARSIVLTDGDGTRHSFAGTPGAGGSTIYTEPAGVYLYLREYSSSDPARKWAFTRPDGLTFFYDADGYPTSVEDRNGNKLSFTLQTIPPAEQQGGISKRVTEVIDAAGQGASPAPNRTYTISYLSADEAVSARTVGKIKSISDHSGHALGFSYYDDGNLLRITESGGANADGTPLADRNLTLTYTNPAGSGPAIGTLAARQNPDPHTSGQSSRLYSVIDARGNETSFAYIAPTGSANDWKLAARTNRAGKTTSYSYETATRTTTQTAPAPAGQTRVSSYLFDAEAKVTSITNPLAQTTSVLWSGDRNVSKVTGPTGTFVEYAYNDNGYLTDSWDELRNRTSLEYQNLAVDSNDVAANWAAGRTIPHISQLWKRTDPNGTATATPTTDYQWIISRDPQGNPTSIQDPLGKNTQTTFNADGTIASVIDANNHATTYVSYDANGLPTQIRDEKNGITRFGYGDDGLLLWQQDANHAGASGPEPRAYRTVFDYDSFRRHGRTSTPKSTASYGSELLIWTSSSYDANDNLTAQRAPSYGSASDTASGPSAQTSYDPMDRPTQLTSANTSADPQGARTQLSYDDAGRLSTVVRSNGVKSGIANDATTRYSYDPLDRVTTETRYLLTPADELRTHYCYTTVGDLKWIVAPKANLASIDCAAAAPSYTTKLAYDDAHRLLSQTDPENNTTSYDYDANGQPTTITDPNGKQTTLAYDQRGERTTMTEPFEAGRVLTTKWEYADVGNLKRLISPRAFDAANGSGSYSNYVTGYQYDELNRLTRIDLPTAPGTTASYIHRTYDPVGNLLSVSLPVIQASAASVPADQKTSLSYFDPGWIRTSSDPANPTVRFDYDAAGRQTERTADAASGSPDLPRRMLWSYDADGQLIELKDQDGLGSRYQYDANGNLTRVTDAGGALAAGQEPLELEQSYDTLDRLTKTRQRKSSGGDWTATLYSYDRNGNLASEEANASEGAAPAPGRLLTFTYDSADRPLTAVDDNATAALASDDQRITTSFDPFGRLLERLVENRTSGSWQLDQRTLHSYYFNGLRKTLETSNAAGSVLETHTLGYDDENGDHANGNRTQDLFRLVGPDADAPCRASVCTAGYRYDAQERLTRFDDGHGTVTSYTLDPAGNVTEEAVTSGGTTTTTSQSFVGNQLRSQTSAGTSKQWWYDPRGNVDCITTGSGSQGDCSPASGAAIAAGLLQDYSYDPLNRLTSARTFAAGSETDSARYAHDPLDRPVAQTESHSGQLRTTSFSYIGAGSDLAAEEQRDAQGALLTSKRYGYDQLGLKTSLLDTPAGQSASRSTYGYDAHGSVSLLLGGGGATAAYAYTPYGKPDPALTRGDTSGTNPLNAYRYSGKRLDSGSGTLDLGARRFHPDSGRFLQHDSYTNALANLALATDPLTGNRYSLAAGNPISFVEVDGHYVTDEGASPGSTADQAANMADGYRLAGCDSQQSFSNGLCQSLAGATAALWKQHDLEENRGAWSGAADFIPVIGEVRGAIGCVQQPGWGCISALPYAGKITRAAKITHKAIKGKKAAKAGSGAANVVNGVRLRAQLAGQEIAGGHAFEKHVITGGQFPVRSDQS